MAKMLTVSSMVAGQDTADVVESIICRHRPEEGQGTGGAVGDGGGNAGGGGGGDTISDREDLLRHAHAFGGNQVLCALPQPASRAHSEDSY
jgi:hypothetical protein